MIFNKVICILLLVIASVSISFATPEELIELLGAHEQWVTAFENADIKAADKVWSHESDVTGIDPIGLKAVGWKDVRRNLRWGFAFVGPSEMMTWDVVISAKRGKGSVTLNYIWKGVLQNRTFKTTELYREENGQWKLYYNDAKGLKPPLFPDDEEAIKRLVAEAKWAYLAFDLPALENLFAPSHRYLDYTGNAFCGRDASITALSKEQNSVSLSQFDNTVIFLWQDGLNLMAEATFRLRYNETKNARGSFLFKKQFKKQEDWNLFVTNLFGHPDKLSPPWDVNCDGIVDISDLVLVGQHFREYKPSFIRVDVNGDGMFASLSSLLKTVNYKSCRYF